MPKEKPYKHLAGTDFPIYTLQSLGNRHIVVSGGGGQAKTGVPNAFEIFELTVDGDGSVQAISIWKQDLGRAAAMNSCLLQSQHSSSKILAVGADADCSVYSIKQRLLPSTTQDDGKTVLRKRKTAFTKSKDNETAPRVLSFTVDLVRTVKADQSGGDDGFQRSVCAAPDASALYTAACDGYIRMWKLPDVEEVKSVKSHTAEIDEITISPDSKHIVSIGKDRKAKAWLASDLSEVKELLWEQPEPGQFRYRAARFSKNERSETHHILYTVHVPFGGSKQRPSSYLTKWSFPDYIPRRISKVGHRDTVCSLTVSDTGRYVGLATMSGGVSVHAAFSLQELYWVPDAHDLFVTALSFAPSTCPINATSEFSLISASVDNTLILHQLPNRSTFSGLWLLPILCIVTLLTFYLLAVLGL